MASGLHQKARRVVRRGLARIGYDTRNWLRIRQIEAWRDFFSEHPRGDMLEISPGWNSTWARTPALSYTAVQYPDFDICKDRLSRTFDYVIADQVLEHSIDTDRSLANIHAMTARRGYALIAAPFLFRVHGRPHDFYRWTEQGIAHVCRRAGFDCVETGSWGNKRCARAHIGGRVKDFGFGRDMANDPEYPMMTWAICHRSQ